MTETEYCCAGARHLGRHTADCEQPQTIVRSALRLPISADKPDRGPCACIGGNACGEGLCE